MFREQKVIKIIKMNREGVVVKSILFVICLYLYKMDVFLVLHVQFSLAVW